MQKVIEINVQTGKRTEREMTAEEIALLPTEEPVVFIESDPVKKLKSFIAANPDVAALLQI